MQRSPENAHVERRRGRRVRHDDVEMLEAEVVERQRLGRRRLRDHPGGEGDGQRKREPALLHQRLAVAADAGALSCTFNTRQLFMSATTSVSADGQARP